LGTAVEDIVAGIVRRGAHAGDLAQSDRPTTTLADHEVAERSFARKTDADLEIDLFAAEGTRAELPRTIGGLDDAHDLLRRDA
jgi:hypothetical protein